MRHEHEKGDPRSGAENDDGAENVKEFQGELAHLPRIFPAIPLRRL
jgi:hypothetical protein